MLSAKNNNNSPRSSRRLRHARRHLEINDGGSTNDNDTNYNGQTSNDDDDDDETREEYEYDDNEQIIMNNNNTTTSSGDDEDDEYFSTTDDDPQTTTTDGGVNTFTSEEDDDDGTTTDDDDDDEEEDDDDEEDDEYYSSAAEEAISKAATDAITKANTHTNSTTTTGAASEWDKAALMSSRPSRVKALTKSDFLFTAKRPRAFSNDDSQHSCVSAVSNNINNNNNNNASTTTVTSSTNKLENNDNKKNMKNEVRTKTVIKQKQQKLEPVIVVPDNNNNNNTTRNTPSGSVATTATTSPLSAARQRRRNNNRSRSPQQQQQQQQQQKMKTVVHVGNNNNNNKKNVKNNNNQLHTNKKSSSSTHSSPVHRNTTTSTMNNQNNTRMNVFPSSNSTVGGDSITTNNDIINSASSVTTMNRSTATAATTTNGDLSAGVLPDVLMTMRQKIESMSLFDSDMIKFTSEQLVSSGHSNSNSPRKRNNGNNIYYFDDDDDDDDDPIRKESRESLKRSSQQSISAAVLVSLAHKRYERRRLAAMEIEKVVRSLVVLQQQNKSNNNSSSSNNNNNNESSSNNNNTNLLDRVRAILLLLSDDYVRSTNEDARKGGVVALAACAIGLKRANDTDPIVLECRDLILASVVHACQDHSQRVRYYATESLFNVVKVIPSLAVQHFFILFEVLRSLFADVDSDVCSGAELLDKKLKEVIVGAMNAGIFTSEQCVPVFARFVYMRNKATKRLTLTWLQELNEKLVGSPILEFLHLFLSGVIEMVADPSIIIRQSALAFLQSVLPKLLVVNNNNNNSTTATTEDNNEEMKVDFDKILQSLVTTMEHANPFVRKVAMYWMSRIVKAHIFPTSTINNNDDDDNNNSKTSNTPTSSPTKKATILNDDSNKPKLSSAFISVRNSVPHVLPGILLSVGDNFVSHSGTTTAKDTFLPDQSTRSLAEQTNSYLQAAVRRDGSAYVEHLDGFIVALREEMATPGGFSSKNPPAYERTPYRMDVQPDGTGIETGGWYRSSRDVQEKNEEAMVMSRLCALHWVIVLYESVVPDPLKADYAREFVFAIIHQLADNPPQTIVYKSLEVLARITVPVSGEDPSRISSASPVPGFTTRSRSISGCINIDEILDFPMTDNSVNYAMKLLDPQRRKLKSRDREVFSALIQLHADNEQLISDLSSVITYMCKLQPPEFVMVSFAVELDRFVKRRVAVSEATNAKNGHNHSSLSRDLRFVSSFVQHMNHVLLNTEEAKLLRDALKDCVAAKQDTDEIQQRSRLFHILLHSFSHNIAATLSLCLWCGAYRTASLLLNKIDPLDISLICLLEFDRLVEMLERPLYRHLHVRMLEQDRRPNEEGSGVMLFQLLKSLLMILPQSTCYRILRNRLVSVSRFRQSAIPYQSLDDKSKRISNQTKTYVTRVLKVRQLHCDATWQTIRDESLEVPKRVKETIVDEGADRRSWLGYKSKEEQQEAQRSYQENKNKRSKNSSNENNNNSSSGETSNDDTAKKYEDLSAVVGGEGQNATTSAMVFLENRDDKCSLEEALFNDGDGNSEGQWKEFWSENGI